MAYCTLNQVSVTIPLNRDSSIQRSWVYKKHSISLREKSWISFSSLNLKNKTAQSRNHQFIVCMSVQQASKPKVAVSSIALEDAKEPPLNLYKSKGPYTATIVSVERIVGPKAPGETCHIVIDRGGNVPYWEGQSYGVIPPGENPKKPGSPNNVHLTQLRPQGMGTFSMARLPVCVFDVLSTMILRQVKKTLPRKGYVATSCVTQSLETRSNLQNQDINPYAVSCMNIYAGPSGKIMLLPEDDPNATHIMIGAGTGIAPFRGYLRRMFMESVPTFRFNGLAWLFLGVANTDSLLYDEEFTKYLQDYPDNFLHDRALSREQKNKSGGKMYVQDKIEEYSDEIFKLLDGGAHIYFCGLKGMMPGIQETLKRVAERRGEKWEEKLSQLKKNKQWHVEVY